MADNKEIMPCPINEKDLCSDSLFEGLFDDNAYIFNGTGTLVGFVNGKVVTIEYYYNSCKVQLRFIGRGGVCKTDKDSVTYWLDDLKEGMNTDEESEYLFSYILLEVDGGFNIVFNYIKK